MSLKCLALCLLLAIAFVDDTMVSSTMIACAPGHIPYCLQDRLRPDVCKCGFPHGQCPPQDSNCPPGRSPVVTKGGKTACYYECK
uniref:Putative secreted peptide n=1 Tax=Hyalomma excavatum TaxID=257692 RepID=A0A131XNJ3_9ACAR